MAAIARISIGAGRDGASLWTDVVTRVLLVLQSHGVLLRDAIVLVPYAALIEPVRAAFAARPGWQPRVETALTLAAALGPADEASPGQCSGDPALDRLQAAQWLAAMDDGHGAIDREHAAALLAEAAGALAAVAAQRPPAQRAAWQLAVQNALPSSSEGTGAVEGSLLRAAAAWAAQAPTPVTDRVFALAPAAWVVLRIGGPDRLAEQVLLHSTCGGCLVDLDPSADEPFVPWVEHRQPRLVLADDFETEAMAAAAEVLSALARTEGRVALVALDRVLVRRVAALLLRAGVALDDETGWKLSTTAAAGQVLARLRAAAVGAGGDERLDWLKRWPLAQSRPSALRALEAAWRGGRNARLSSAEQAAAAALWQQAQAVLAAWQSLAERSLLDWLSLLRAQLLNDGEWAVLAADAAGARLLQVMQFGHAGSAWQAVLGQTRLNLAAFSLWIESWCETTTVQRSPCPGSRVVLTPLARAVGRPFVHVVLAGADAQRLGRDAGGPALVGEHLAEALGLETAGERRQRQRLALAQLLRAPGLSILWRRLDAGAPNAPASDVEWLQSSWLQAGRPLAVQAPHFEHLLVPAQATPRPLPHGEQALPAALSASAVEALRQCPYRFFARSVLRLSEQDELDEPLRKRDYGDWLHATLHHFHSTRQPRRDDALALAQSADVAMLALELDPAALLAFRASMQQVLPAYLDWLQRHEAEGWHWLAGEDELAAAPAAWAPQTLRGRIDRIDAGAAGERLVLDYKTGSYASLRARLAEPLEDTQLPFYAALLHLQAQSQGVNGTISAAYLALDERDGPKLLAHPNVQATADAMLVHLAGELERLRAGAPMPALGEGAVCDTCEARGLCRRDQWQPAPPPAP